MSSWGSGGQIADEVYAEMSPLQRTYTKSGQERFRVVVSHRGLGKVQEMTGADHYLLLDKARGKMQQWDAQWQKRVATQRKAAARARTAREREAKKELAAEQTREAEAAWAEAEAILEHTLGIDDAIDWDGLVARGEYQERPPTAPLLPNDPPYPGVPPEPQASWPEFQDQVSFFGRMADGVAPARRERRQAALREAFEAAHGQWLAHKEQVDTHWQAEVARVRAHRDGLLAGHQRDHAAWEQRRADFYQAQQKHNNLIAGYHERWHAKDPQAVKEYCDLVLERSVYPDWYSQEWNLQFNGETGLAAVALQLPTPSDLPTLKTVKYVQSRDEFDEKYFTEKQVEKLYDSVIYQVVLRTIHELIEADRVGAISSVALNGYVRSIDPATGHEVNACVASLHVGREEFEAMNLAHVEPKKCFRKLKGVGSAKLHSLTPVAPIVQLDMDDDRFVGSYEVVSTLDQGENLASMDWEDFEHLVREVFEREFSANGGTVKVTRASRDGGIDAVIFDPDPLRGGKIVVQAKRYTNTVGVAAVRDLYGALMNEGANKGILVTTSAYGPDAYAFAKDKPLTLLDGGGLLHLMQKHGHDVRIDLVAAKAAR